MFYNMLKSISGVKLISHKENSFKLLNNSIFSATITGSVALESAVIGKKSIVLVLHGMMTVQTFLSGTKI